MRNTIIISIILLLFFCGCNKNKYNTVPSLKFKSVNTNLLSNFQVIQFTLSFTDKEGDLTDSITVIKTEPKCTNSNFVQPYKLPTFPTTKNISGDLLVSFKYSDVAPQCPGRNDTAVFKFVLKDQAKHVSDTASSPTIVILQ